MCILKAIKAYFLSCKILSSPPTPPERTYLGVVAALITIHQVYLQFHKGVVQSRSWEFAPVNFSHNTANFRPIFMKIYMYVYLLYTKKCVPKNSQKIPNLAKFWNWHKTLKEQEKSIF